MTAKFMGSLWRVPELPPHFLPRPDDTVALVDALLADAEQAGEGGQAVGIGSAGKHGVHGMGGIGKSVLASAVARSERVRERFSDGVYWLTVGQTPQLTSLQAQLGKTLGLADTAFDSPADGKHHLAECLSRKAVLLVLDDVWNAEHASWLDVVGTSGRVLMTTRNLDVLTWRGAIVHALDVMSMEQARALLCEWVSASPDALPDEANQVADACGRLPLALAVAGALVRRPGGSWSRVLGLLQSARLERLRGQVPAYPYRNVYQVIEASVNQLATDSVVPDAARCYTDLAVFAEDEAIPRAALCVLWGRLGLDAEDVDELAGALATHALASLHEHDAEPCSWSLRLHDIQRAYAHACVGDDAALAALHSEMVDAFTARCAQGLEHGPTVETATPGERTYFFDRLPYHLVAACRDDELRGLLWSYVWLDCKLLTVGFLELLNDFESVQPDLSMLRDTLWRSGHILVRYPEQLPAQLVGRLAYFEAEEPKIGILLQDARAQTSHPWLCPITPTLAAPGHSVFIRAFEGHSECVVAAAVSADGSSALTGDLNGTLKLWDARTGLLKHVLHVGPSKISALALSGDGCIAIASRAYESAIRVWNTKTGHLQRVLDGHTRAIRVLSLDRSGARALSGSYDKTIRLWDTATGQLLRTFEGHDGSIRALAFSVDGTLLLSASYDKTVKLWDAYTGKLLRTFEGCSKSSMAVAFCEDGARVVACARDEPVRVWDTETGKTLLVCRSDSGEGNVAALSLDGSRALSDTRDGTLLLWDTRISDPIMRIFDGHAAPAWSGALSEHGTRALSGAHDGSLKLWDTTSRRDSARPTTPHSHTVQAVAFSRNGKRALSGSSDRTVKLWDPWSGQALRVVGLHSGWVRSVALSADGALALSGSNDRTMSLWNTRTGERLHTFTGHSARVNAVAFVADGTYVVSGSKDRTIKLWDTRSGELLHTFKGHGDKVMAVAASWDGTRLVSGSIDRTVKVWDLPTLQLLYTFKGHSAAVNTVAWGADARYAVSGSHDNTVKVWDAVNGRLVRSLAGHSGPVRSVALSHDGELVLSGSEDKTIRIWTAHDGRNLLTFTSDWPVLTCDLWSGAEPLVCAGDESGRVHFCRLVGVQGSANATADLPGANERNASIPARSELVEELFAQAVDMASARRAAFLDVRCAQLPEVRRQVEALLRSDREPGSILSSTVDEFRESPKRDTSSLDQGMTLGKYRITGTLGKGGMGVVYTAEHVDFGNQVVIKTLRSRYSDDTEAIERFKDEAHALARIRHPSILTVYGGGVHTDGQVYIVLEQLDGESLEVRLRRVRTLEPTRALTFIQQAARALVAVHEVGIIHRDLKPDNLFVVSDPEVPGGERIKILDFGIAKLSVGPREGGAHETLANVAMGTPPYMPPEQWTDARTADARTDLYALGVIMFRMLAGQLPFERPNLLGYMHAHAHDPIPALHDIDPTLPRELDDIVSRLMAKKPDERFASARELVAAIDAVDLRSSGGATRLGVKPPTVPHVEAFSSPLSAEPSSQVAPVSAPRGRLWRVPTLPRHFLPRPKHTEPLERALLTEDTAQHVGIHGVHGMGGIGKTVLATFVAQSEAVRAHFVDGIYWLTVGKNPQLTTLQAQLGKALGMADTAFESQADGRQRLAEHLADKRALLVLDDVWDAQHADWLQVVGASGRALLTTRNLDVLIAQRAIQHALDIMGADQARFLLAEWTGMEPEKLPPEARDVAEACGRLPIALAMAGALVCRPGGTFSRVLRLLESAKLDKLRGDLPAYPYRNVYQVIEASVTQLIESDGHDSVRVSRCYTDLAVFAEDETIPRDALRVLWGRLDLDDDDVDDLASTLATYALANMDQSGETWHLRLHDIQRAYVRASTSDVPALHADFVEAFRRRCKRGLESGPDHPSSTDGERTYYFARMAYHLVEAGRADQLRQLLMSYRWLDGKVRTSGFSELIADFERVPCSRSMALVRDALRLSSHILAEDPDQLPGQLIGRLGYFEADENLEPEIVGLLERIRAQVEHEWICPALPTLTSPGGPLVRTFEGHSSRVLAVALSGDGMRALSGSKDRTVKLWDTNTGLLLRTFEALTSSVLAVALSEDGTRVLSGMSDHTVRLWDANTGSVLRTLEGHESPVNAVALNSDGTRALSGSSDKTIKLWDTSNGALLRTFKGHSSSVDAIALSRDGTRLISGSYDKTVRLWDVDAGTVLRTFAGHSSPVYSVALSEDGGRALSGAGDTLVKLWDTNTGAVLRTFEGHASSVLSVALSRDGARALSSSRDKTIKLWDTNSGSLLQTFEGHSSSVLAVALSADGTWALSGSYDRTVKLWATNIKPVLHSFEGHSSSVNAVALSKDGTRALSGSHDNTLKLWDTNTCAVLSTFEGHSSPIHAVALSEDGRLALSGSSDKTVKLWDVGTGTVIQTFEGHSSSVHAVALSQDGTRVISGSSDKTLKLWDASRGDMLHDFARPTEPRYAITGGLLATFRRHSASINAVALSQDGTRVLSGSENATLKLWDTNNGTVLRTFEGHSSPVNAVSLSKDGSRALSGSWDKTAILWDTSTGAVLHTFEGHRAPLNAVALSGDGTLALSGSSDNTLKLWDTSSGQNLLSFAVDRPIVGLAFYSGTEPMICVGDQAGHVHFLRVLAPLRER